MKLKSENGKVTFLMRTGKDFAQNTMSETAANELIKNGKVTESDVSGYPICVDGRMFFPREDEIESDPVPASAPVRKTNRRKEDA